MGTMRKAARGVIVLAAAVLLAACGGAGAVGDKAGGTGTPVVLRLGTDDGPRRPSAEQITEFARRVEELSEGQVVIKPVWNAAGPLDTEWDQAVARMVVGGQLDMALIPARAWDTEGVTSLRALNAPLLVDSDALVEQIVTDDLAEDMLAGLEATGVTGLALLPEGLRHLFLYGSHTLADVRGKLLRAPRSETTWALFEALGATPVDETSREEIEAGTVLGAESSFALATSLPADATAIGNLTLFPKVNALVVRSATFDGLTSAQQSILRDAARSTVAWAVEQTGTDAAHAKPYCDNGGRIIHVSAADIEQARAAARPVYEDLEQDAGTAATIARIEELKRDIPAVRPPASCDGRVESAADEQTDDPALLNGVYRYEVTYDYLLDAGLQQAQAEEESGVHTVTMEDGRFVDAWRNPTSSGECTGTYTIAGSRATFVWDPGCEGDYDITFTVQGDQILWSDVTIHPPHNTPEGRLVAAAFSAVPWTRIGDPPGGQSSEFPDGIYRMEMAAEFLMDAGVDRETAANHEGMWTLTFKEGRFVEGTCEGTYSVEDRRVSILLSDDENCGTAANKELFSAGWRLDGDQLQLLDVRSGHGSDLLIRVLFGGKPFTKIG
jgi:TRAP-type C4-dicarboxylate transport system substrate-binding protein